MSPPNHAWMASHNQTALLEYANVKTSCPPGVYVSITPGSPFVWQGTYFVRKGTYATSILRFRVIIPPEFPERAPTVIFSSDIFHPLVVPLGAFTFSNASPPRKPQKAGDELRLDPGSLNLGYGFPEWFRRRGINEMATTTERRVQEAMAETPSLAQGDFDDAAASSGDEYGQDTPSKRPVASKASASGLAGMGNGIRKLMFMPPPAVDALEYSSTRSYPGMAAVLDYMTQAFEDEDFLDGVGLDDAANAGAMHSWRAYRARQKEVEEMKQAREREREREREKEKEQKQGSAAQASGASTPVRQTRILVPGSAASVRTGGVREQSPREPGQWDWNGVWLERTRKCVKDSASEAKLFKEAVPPSNGRAGRDDDIIEMIRFLDLEKDDVAYIKSEIRTSQRDNAQVTLDILKTEARTETWQKVKPLGS